MGKVRRQRQKFHLAGKSKAKENPVKAEEKDPEDGTQISHPFTSDIFKSGENIFAGVNIKHEDLFRKLSQDFDVGSVVSSKSRREQKLEEQHMKKKDKIKLRRERFMKKIDIVQQNMKELRNKKKRQKTVIVGDMKPLADALPSLESLAVNKAKKESLKLKRKPKAILKLKQRQKQQSADIKMFKQIINDKTFKLNPTQTVTEYLKQKLAKERPS